MPMSQNTDVEIRVAQFDLRYLGGEKECGMRGFEQVYADGRTTTVSFRNDPWNAVLSKAATRFNLFHLF